MGDESYLRTIIKPLESLLTGYKRILIRDTAVDAVCHGAKLTLTGVLRLEPGIEMNEEVVIITTKGEAVAIAYAMMSYNDMMQCQSGFAAKIKRVIMERGVYPRSWGHGTTAVKKKTMKSQGLLDVSAALS